MQPLVEVPPGKLAEAAAVKAAEAWPILEEQDNVADALVQDHKDIVMDKTNDIHEESDHLDDEWNGDKDNTRGYKRLICSLRTHSFHRTSASWGRSLPRSAATAKRPCFSRRLAWLSLMHSLISLHRMQI